MRGLCARVGLCLIVALAVAATALAESVTATKLLIDDGVVVEITNTGVLTAANRLYHSDRMPADVKTLAIGEVLTGAMASGMLVKSTLVVGDTFFALDADTGYVIVVTVEATESFKLPTGTYSFSKWLIPS